VTCSSACQVTELDAQFQGTTACF